MRRCPRSDCGWSNQDSHRFCLQCGADLGSGPSAVRVPTRRRAPIRKETIVLMITIGVILAVVVGLLAFKQSQSFTLHVVFRSGAHGLDRGDNVFVLDRRSGEVTDVHFDENGGCMATILVWPDAARLLRQDTWFYVGFENVLGKRCVATLIGDDPDSPPLQSGDEVAGVDSQSKVRWKQLQDLLTDDVGGLQN